MNAVEYEREYRYAKVAKKTNKVNVLSINEYIEMYLQDLRKDLLMIIKVYEINAKGIYKEIVKECYQKNLRNPRLRINYQKRGVELYNLKKFQAQTIQFYKL